MTKEQAQERRARCIEAVKDAQAACAKAVGPVEHDRAKAGLAAALEQLAEAKAELRKVNLLTSGAKPIEPPPPPRRLSTEETATVLLEAFQRLLIADPAHPAIRTLRAHFDAERFKDNPPTPVSRPTTPIQLRSTGHNFLDSSRRAAAGPGARLYKP
jgi:hypothetical protein